LFKNWTDLHPLCRRDGQIFFVAVMKVQVPVSVDSFWVATPCYKGLIWLERVVMTCCFLQGVDGTWIFLCWQKIHTPI